VSAASDLVVSATFGSNDPQAAKVSAAHAVITGALSSDDALKAAGDIQLKVTSDGAISASVKLNVAGGLLSAAAPVLHALGLTTLDGSLTLAGDMTASIGAGATALASNLALGKVDLKKALADPTVLLPLLGNFAKSELAQAARRAWTVAASSSDPALRAAAGVLKLVASYAVKHAGKTSALTGAAGFALNVGMGVLGAVATAPDSGSRSASLLNGTRAQVAADLQWHGLNLKLQAKLGAP
jgi:hypothetical protein